MSKNWDRGEELTARGLNTQTLKASAQEPPDLTLHIAAGVSYVDGVLVRYAGGNSPTIPAPTTNPRIDLIAIDSTGVIIRIAGTEATTPTPPLYPVNQLVLAEIFCRVGMTQITNNNVAGQGYILRDARALGAITKTLRFVELPDIASSTISDNTLWQDWNLSAHIPTGAKFVDIWMQIERGRAAGVRRKGSTVDSIFNAPTVSGSTTWHTHGQLHEIDNSVLSRFIFVVMTAELDVNRIIQRRIYPLFFSAIFKPVGYWM